MTKNKHVNLIALSKMLNVGFIKEIVDEKGYSIVYLIC